MKTLTSRLTKATPLALLATLALSACDAEFAPGTQVTVIWGDRGGVQRRIRATVAKLPFKEDKRRMDVTKL